MPPGWQSVLFWKMSRNSVCNRAGKFVLSGGPEVAERLEKTGYSEWGKEEAAQHGEPQEVA